MADKRYIPTDLYGVYRDREALLRKTELPYFAAWWQGLLADLEAVLERPAWPEIAGLAGMDEDARQNARHERLSAASREMLSLSFVYAMTGDARTARRAGEIALHLVEETDIWAAPVHRDIYPELHADLRFSSLCQELSISLGWIGHTLSKKDAERLLSSLATQGNVIYQDALNGAWWGDALNSNWTSHLMHGLGAAGLALLGSKRSPAHGAEMVRPWVEMATDIMRRMLDLAGEEGGGIEGIGYYMGCYASILNYATELRNVTGESLFDHEFWRKSSLFPLYQTLPDLSGRTPIGDTHYPGLSGSTLLCGLAREARDGLAQWQAHRVLEEAEVSRIGLLDLIYYDPTVPETPPNDLPPCRVFHSVQIATFRSGWERDAVYMHFHGGSNSWSHCHLDLNAFTLAAYGERLAIDHGSWGYSKHYFRVVEPQISTAWHNTIVVDGADQRQVPRYRMSYDPTEGGSCYSILSQHLSCEGLEMIRGDATSAYADMLERSWREIVYLRPDRFIIYDNLLTKNVRVQRHVQWLLHSEAPMVEMKDRIEVRGEKAKLVVQPIYPLGWRCRFPDRLARARARGHEHGASEIREVNCLSVFPDWVHIWNESPSKPAYPQWDERGGVRVYGPDYPYLVVLSPLHRDEEIDWTIEPLKAAGVEGVRIISDDQVDTVIFKRFGGSYSLGGVISDGEKVVIREEDGRITSAALVNGTTLQVRGHALVAETQPVSRALDF